MKHYNLGKNNGNYKHGKTNKTYRCLDCNNKVSDFRHKRCKKCQSTKYNNFKSNTKIVKDKIRNSIDKHHLYLKENSEVTVKVSHKLHKQLHNKAYEYIFKKYGKEEIHKYIKWFEKKYGVKIC